MPQIDYEIKEYLKQIFVVVVPNSYTRAMLFLRVQEFYESTSNKFRNKGFSFWDYKEWYCLKNKGKFTYASDWSGFNVPLKNALECRKSSRIETPYDKEMNKIISRVQKAGLKDSYIIGVDKIGSNIFRHEMCHALYRINPKYKKEANRLMSLIDKKSLGYIKDHLKKLGYCNKVMMDEVQAYICTGGDGFIEEKIRVNLKNKIKKLFQEAYIVLKQTL